MRKTNIETALEKRRPEGVALIVCQDKKGVVDITPICWFMLCNTKPRYWAISLFKTHYSHKVISKTKEFILCLPSYSQKKDILYCGSVHGWDTNKLKSCRFKTFPSKKVQPPILKDSIACFECRVVNTCPTIDHTIFIGRIMASHVSAKKDKVYNLGGKKLIRWKIK